MQRANTIWRRDLAVAAALGAAVAVLLAVERSSHSGLSGGAPSASLVEGAKYLSDLRIRLHEPSGPLASHSLRSDALQGSTCADRDVFAAIPCNRGGVTRSLAP